MSVSVELRGRGWIRGSRSEGGALVFRNIPFASVKQRFGKAEIVPPWKDEQDCTNWGGSDTLVGGTDEAKCLNLSLYVPPSVDLKAAKDIPIVAWVHGGSFTGGSNNFLDYDATKFAELASEIGQEVVFVGLPYRLGILGWFYCDDLHAEAASQDYTAGNQGLMDIKLGLEYIKNHIAPLFGSELVTIGESAGAIILQHIHYIYPDLGIKKTILLSGGVSTVTARPRQFCQQDYKKLLQSLEIKDLSELRKIPIDELQKAANSIYKGFGPILDDLIIKEEPRRWLFNRPTGVEQALISQCVNEGYLFAFRASFLGKKDKLARYITSVIPPPLQEEAQKLYLYPNKDDEDDYGDALSDFMGAYMFHSASDLTCDIYANKIPVYKMQVGVKSNFLPDGWPPTHGTDLPGLFLMPILNFEELKMAKVQVGSIIRFVKNGGTELEKNGWERYNPSKRRLFRIEKGASGMVDDGVGGWGTSIEKVDFWERVIARSAELNGYSRELTLLQKQKGGRL